MDCQWVCPRCQRAQVTCPHPAWQRLSPALLMCEFCGQLRWSEGRTHGSSAGVHNDTPLAC